MAEATKTVEDTAQEEWAGIVKVLGYEECPEAVADVISETGAASMLGAFSGLTAAAIRRGDKALLKVLQTFFVRSYELMADDSPHPEGG